MEIVMGKIHVLDTEVSNKIAAGEVVERPASVVKELVENSIDAGASAVSVEIKNGGSVFIRVTDNGSGMSAEDARIAFLRHATSKISSAEDLDAIYTFGFRGEALSSIGAVARVELMTKRAEERFGTRVLCEGGEIVSDSESGCADGTCITVSTLFYNTPARMKFMKKDATEAGYISDIITRFILAHPEISFRLVSNGKEQLFSPGDGSIINAVYAVYGRDYALSMIEADYEIEGVHVTGVTGKGTLARPNRNFQSFFVNKRYIKSPLMMKAAEEAYKNQIMIGKFPVLALNLEINPAMIDINVHPTKLEVKFSNEKQIYEAVYYAVKNALYAIPNVPELKLANHDIKPDKEDEVAARLRDAVSGKTSERINPFTEIKNAEKQPQTVFKKQETNKGQLELGEMKAESTPAATVSGSSAPEAVCSAAVHDAGGADPFAEFRKKNKAENALHRPAAAEPEVPYIPQNKVIPQVQEKKHADAPEHEKPDNKAKKPNNDDYIKIAGQVFDTYIIAQRGNDEMLVIDQHAAHERIKYEQIKRDAESHELYPQILLEPVVISMSAPEMSVYRENVAELETLGFETDEFGDSEIIVRAAPAEIEWSDVEALVLELITECGDNRRELKGAKQERFLYTVACKAAIKANHTLTEAEMKTLVEAVLDLENINTCPHGRPIIISMTKKELEKQFKRIV